MFSSRLPGSLAWNRISRAIEEACRRGVELCDLTNFNPTTVGIAYPREAILEALADPRALVYEPTPKGLGAAREAVASYYAGRGRAVDPERLVLTASTSEAYAYLFKLLCNPGEAVLVPEPSYPLFELLARLEAVETIAYPLRYHGGWFLDVGELERELEDRVRAIVVVNPNNPTGSYLKRGELEGLQALCRARGLALISDEVFADYAFAADPERVDTLAGEHAVLSFSLSGLSKLVGLPQAKLGWIHVGAEPAPAAQAVERLELIADTYLSVSSAVQYACARLLELGSGIRARIAERVRVNRQLVEDTVGGSELELLQAEGGWSAVLRVPRTATEEDWVLELLERDRVLVQPGFFYDFAEAAYLVLSLLVPPETLEYGLGRLLERARRLGL